MIKIGINGLNIISKMIIYNTIKNNNIKIVALNIQKKNIDINSIINMFNNDNFYKLPKITIIKDIPNNTIIINNKYKIKIFNLKNLNWGKLKAKYIIDTTKIKNPEIHIKNGAKKVILTYPNFKLHYPIYVLGVNHNMLNNKNKIIFYASNITNSLSPILKILHREYYILECFITILQNKIYYKKYDNEILTKTKITPYKKNKIYKEIYKVIPEMYNKIKDITFNIPYNFNISVLDLSIKFKKSTNYENIKKKIKFYSLNEFSGILKYFNNTINYNDILYDTNSTIYDNKSGLMLNKNFFKIICWFNNDISYSKKIINFIEYIENNS